MLDEIPRELLYGYPGAEQSMENLSRMCGDISLRVVGAKVGGKPCVKVIRVSGPRAPAPDSDKFHV